MSKVAEIPVFYRDDNEVCASPKQLMTREDCRNAKQDGRGKFFDNGKKFRLFASRPKLYPVTAASLRSSNVLPQACTITTSELLANVGIAGTPEDVAAPRHLVREAQEKIRAYMHKSMRETQAPTAYGRWPSPMGAIQIAVIQ
jgi:hypothetical protein